MALGPGTHQTTDDDPTMIMQTIKITFAFMLSSYFYATLFLLNTDFVLVDPRKSLASNTTRSCLVECPPGHLPSSLPLLGITEPPPLVEH